MCKIYFKSVFLTIVFVLITRIKLSSISIHNFKQVTRNEKRACLGVYKTFLKLDFLLVKTILSRILLNIVIWAQFEFKIAFMICCDLYSDFHFLSGFKSVHNNSISVSSRNFMRFWTIPWITTNSTFSSKTLLMLKRGNIHIFLYQNWQRLCKPWKSYSTGREGSDSCSSQ